MSVRPKSNGLPVSLFVLECNAGNTIAFELRLQQLPSCVNVACERPTDRPIVIGRQREGKGREEERRARSFLSCLCNDVHTYVGRDPVPSFVEVCASERVPASSIRIRTHVPATIRINHHYTWIAFITHVNYLRETPVPVSAFCSSIARWFRDGLRMTLRRLQAALYYNACFSHGRIGRRVNCFHFKATSERVSQSVCLPR